MFIAQLNTNSREQFRCFPGRSEHFIRAEIEAPSALCSASFREKDHACPGSGGIAFDFGERVAALDVGKVGRQNQEVDAGLLNKLESFDLGGRHGHVVASRTHKFLKHLARDRVGVNNQNTLAVRGQVCDLKSLGSVGEFDFPCHVARKGSMRITGNTLLMHATGF